MSSVEACPGTGGRPLTIITVALINFLSAFIQAASGLGYAIFAMFFMPMVLPFQQCSLISAAVIVVIGIQMTVSLRSYIDVRKVILPMFFCILTTGVGIYIIRVTNAGVLRKTMGVFLLVLSVYFYITEKHGIKVKESFLSGAAIDAITGLTTGMFNIVGPFLTLYYYGNSKNNLEFKANLEFSFLIAGIYSLCLNLFYIKPDAFLLKTIGLSAIASVAAGITGLRLFRKLDRKKLKYVILCTLPLMGVIQLVR